MTDPDRGDRVAELTGGLAAAREQVDECLDRAHLAVSAHSCSTSAIPVALSG